MSPLLPQFVIPEILVLVAIQPGHLPHLVQPLDVVILETRRPHVFVVLEVAVAVGVGVT